MIGIDAFSVHEWWRPYIVNCGAERPSRFAEALSKTIPPKTKVLDLGCGSGIVGLYCLIERKAESVTFVDVRREWIEITRENVARKINEGVIHESQVAILEAGCFTNLSPEVLGRHDLVAFNPPQLPSNYFDEPGLDKIESDAVCRDFRRGGPDGLDVVKEFLGWYIDSEHRKPSCLLLLSSFLGRKLIARMIRSFGLAAEIVAQTRSPLRRGFWPAAERLSQSQRADRLLARADDGWTKQLLTYQISALSTSHIDSVNASARPQDPVSAA